MKNKKPMASIISISIAIFLMVMGIYRSEFSIYYRKAVSVCLQCIGIG